MITQFRPRPKEPAPQGAKKQIVQCYNRTFTGWHPYALVPAEKAEEKVKFLNDNFPNHTFKVQ